MVWGRGGQIYKEATAFVILLLKIGNSIKIEYWFSNSGFDIPSKMGTLLQCQLIQGIAEHKNVSTAKTNKKIKVKVVLCNAY